MNTNGKANGRGSLPGGLVAPRRTSRTLRRLASPLGLSCVLALAGNDAHAVDVRIAGQESVAPKWVYLRNRVVGICPDILAAVERVEPRLHFVGYRQSRSLPGIDAGLDGGSVDVACALLAMPSRRAVAEAVGPVVYTMRHRLVARGGDDADVHSTKDLARMKAWVIGQRGSIFTERLRAAGVKVDDSTDDNAVNLRKLLAGHGRFLDINELTLQHYLRNQDLGQRVRVLPPVLGDEPAYFWVSRKADPGIVRLLGPALQKLKASGELERILAERSAVP